MNSDNSFPTPGQLVDKVPLIRNPGFWVPKPVELPPDIQPLPEDVHAYFVYDHSLESHVLSTLPSALQNLQQTHSQRLHLLASYADSKERARKARLNQVAPGYAEGGAALEPTRRRETAMPASASGLTPAIKQRSAEESLLGESDEEGSEGKAPSTPTAPQAANQAQGSFLGGPEFGSPKEAGEATLDKMQRDQMLDFFEGLEQLDNPSFGGGGGGGSGGEVDDLI
ncbi:hypothetical protein JCM11641_005159 [Rhodosporidiobolus odoratus]